MTAPKSQKRHIINQSINQSTNQKNDTTNSISVYGALIMIIATAFFFSCCATIYGE